MFRLYHINNDPAASHGPVSLPRFPFRSPRCLASTAPPAGVNSKWLSHWPWITVVKTTKDLVDMEKTRVHVWNTQWDVFGTSNSLETYCSGKSSCICFQRFPSWQAPGTYSRSRQHFPIRFYVSHLLEAMVLHLSHKSVWSIRLFRAQNILHWTPLCHGRGASGWEHLFTCDLWMGISVMSSSD